MKENLIQILSITGTPVICYQVDSVKSLSHLYKDKLFTITQTGLKPYDEKSNSKNQSIQQLRYVLAKDEEQKQLLSKVEPIKCFLRFSPTNTRVIKINPYLSVGWLKNLIYSQKKVSVGLTINNVDLSQNNQSLLKYIFENAIIHVHELSQKSKTISVLKIKEPNTQSSTKTIQNIDCSLKISQLIQRVSPIVDIPSEYLYIVYGGKILQKHRLISDYNINENDSYIIAVDSRKYMKKLSQKQYQKRQQEVKQMKQNNKQILKKLRQQIEAEKKEKKSPEKKSSSPQKNKMQYLMQRSGDLNKKDADDIQYFKQPKMSIQSQQYQQFQRMNSKTQVQGQNKPQLNRLNSLLKQGRLVTNQQQVYEDQQGYIHEHKKQKSIFRNGQKIVHTDITQDKDGNIIQIEKDIVNIRRDSATGQVIKTQTDIIQGANVKTTITKQQVRDTEGNIIRYQTSRVTQNNQVIQQTNSNQRALVPHGSSPKVNQHKEVSIDSSGNVRMHQQQIVQTQQKTILFNKNTLLDPQGYQLAISTNVVEIQSNYDGNVHKHKSQILQQENKITLVQTDQIIDLDGQRLRKEKDTIEIEGQEDGSVIKKQTDVIQQNGSTQIIQKSIIQDQYGNVLKSQMKVTNIEQDQYSINIRQKSQIIQQIQASNNQYNQQLSQIKKSVDVIRDQEGNTITREKQYLQDQSGKQMVIHRYVVENSEGQVVRQNTQVVEASLDQNPLIERHIVDYSQQNGKALIVEKLITEDQDGSIIKSEKETVQIEQLEDGTVRKIQTDVVYEEGRSFIYAKNEIQDPSGKILSKTSDIIQIANKGAPLNSLMNQEADVVNQIQVTKINRRYNYDQEGNAYVTQTQMVNSQGAEKLTQRKYLFNQQGQAIITQTGITSREQKQNGNLVLRATDIIQQGSKVTIVQSNRILDLQGNQIQRQSGTLQVKQLEDGLVKKQKETILQNNGVKYKVNKQTYEDESGNIVQQKCMRTEIKTDQQGNKQILQRYTRKHEQVQQDQQGNYRLTQREITDDQNGKLTIVSTQVIRDPQNSLLKATTDVVQLRQLDDGSVHRHEVNIIQKPGKVTIKEDNSIQNSEGERISGQAKQVSVKQGPNDEIIKQSTNTVMEDQAKLVTQKLVIEDSEGNIIEEEKKIKKVFMDQNGVYKQKYVQRYQIQVIQDQQHPQIVQREVIQDQSGNVHTIETQVIQGDHGNIIVQTQTVKNPDGQIIGVQKNVRQTEELSQGIISRQNKQILTNQKVVTSEIVSLVNYEGDVISQKEKRVQVTQEEGLIRKSQFDIIRQQGKTMIDVVNTLQDQEGNIVDQSSNIIKIRDTQQAVREHAKRIARAEIDGQITAVIKRQSVDEQGLTHFIEKQVINDNGKRIVVDTQTIRTTQGEIVKTVTGITQQKLQDGQVRNMKTQITQQDGQIRVVQYSNIQQRQYLPIGQQDPQRDLQDSQMNSKRMQIKLTHSIDLPINQQYPNPQQFEQSSSSKKNVQFSKNYHNEVQVVGSSQFIENEGTRQQESSELPIQSKKQLDQPCGQDIKNSNYHYQHQSQQNQYIPEQYYITLIDKQRNQIRLKIKYDDIMDEVASKLGDLLNKPKDVLKFYKDGSQLQQFQLVSDLNIFPESILYFIDQSD